MDPSKEDTTKIQNRIWDKPHFFSNSTYKAMKVIEELASVEDSGYVSLIELSKRIGQDRSSVYRILNTLQEMMYVDKKDSKYRLTLKFFNLTHSMAGQLNLREIAYPFMKEFAEEVHERVFLSVQDKLEAVQIELVEGNPWIRATSGVGARFPLHASSSGKLFLAAMTDRELQKILPRLEFSRVTEKTIHDKETLQREILQVRENGYAIVDEESRLHERAVAVPVLDPAGNTIAAIGVAGTTLTFSMKNAVACIASLKKVSSQISNAFIL